eukprot:6434135-Amphidinium_carterae.1
MAFRDDGMQRQWAIVHGIHSNSIQRQGHSEALAFRGIGIQSNGIQNPTAFRGNGIQRHWHSEAMAFRGIGIQRSLHSESLAFRVQNPTAFMIQPMG